MNTRLSAILAIVSTLGMALAVALLLVLPGGENTPQGCATAVVKEFRAHPNAKGGVLPECTGLTLKQRELAAVLALRTLMKSGDIFPSFQPTTNNRPVPPAAGFNSLP